MDKKIPAFAEATAGKVELQGIEFICRSLGEDRLYIRAP